MKHDMWNGNNQTNTELYLRVRFEIEYGYADEQSTIELTAISADKHRIIVREFILINEW